MQEVKTEIKTLVFMGRPGSGKGTQAGNLSKLTGFPTFSSGDRFREIVAGGTYLGKQVQKIIDTGELMPEWFSSFLFEEKLLPLAPEKGIIFDGLGRKEEEARFFNEVCQFLERPYRVILVETSEQSVRNRIAKRASEGRADDEAIKLATRFEAYERDTIPAINFFKSLGKLISIDGEPAPEAVWREVKKALDYAD